MISGIYTITNLDNGKVYIGSTNNFGTRWYLHRNSLRKGVHHNQYLQRSWNKFGENVFEFCILEYLDNLDELVKAEQFWMDVYRIEGKELYNFGLAADCPMRGYKYTEEQCHKSSDAHKGHKHSEETKRKIGEGNRGKVMSEEAKQKISEANRGKIVSEETRQKLSMAALGHPGAMLGKHHSEETRRKISDGNRGKVVSLETRRKMSDATKKTWENLTSEEKEAMVTPMQDAWRGCKHSEETRRKISVAAKGRKAIHKSKEHCKSRL